jgi:acyl-CoA thioester hydrolase
MEEGSQLFKHFSPVQIRFNDIDILGHVNNAVHQYYFDIARLNYFRDVFQESVDWKEEALVLASITVDYLQPVFIDDSIEVSTRINHIGNKSIRMIQEILDRNTREIKSTSRSVLVAYHNRLKSAIPVPERWKVKIREFEKKEDAKEMQ